MSIVNTYTTHKPLSRNKTHCKTHTHTYPIRTMTNATTQNTTILAESYSWLSETQTQITWFSGNCALPNSTKPAITSLLLTTTIFQNYLATGRPSNKQGRQCHVSAKQEANTESVSTLDVVDEGTEGQGEGHRLQSLLHHRPHTPVRVDLTCTTCDMSDIRKR